jgi:hypothetical protein
VTQQVLSVFKLARPGEWWIDPCCGGGSRQLVEAYCGFQCLGLDLRQVCVTECCKLATKLGLSNMAHFAKGDMRDVETSVRTFRNHHHAKFGGLFTSIPFWKLEIYDQGVCVKPIRGPQLGVSACPHNNLPLIDLTLDACAGGHEKALLEHCRTFGKFIDALQISLASMVDVLEDGSWLLVHCGPMRHRCVRV